MQPHLLQSPDWQKFSEREGYKTFWRDGDGYYLLAELHHTKLGNYLFCPYGPIAKDLISFQSAIDSLKALAHDQNAFFIRVEPTLSISVQDMQNLGFIKSHDLEPAHTWVIDLTQPQDTILTDIEKTKVRHWRNHQNKNIAIRTTQDPEQITILSSLLQGVGARDHFTPQDESHLKNQLTSGFATLYIAEYEQQPIAASLVYDYQGTRYYAHAATDDAHRKLMAGTILLVQMIIDAKNSGAHTFDFWGITTSDDPHHPWYGFTQYKKSFGGHQVDYTGTWDLPLHKVKYRLYQMLRRANRAQRKLTHPKH